MGDVMKFISLLRVTQILLCFPVIILFATSKMTSLEELIFIMLFTLYTLVYELILLRNNKRKSSSKTFPSD